MQFHVWFAHAFTVVRDVSHLYQFVPAEVVWVDHLTFGQSTSEIAGTVNVSYRMIILEPFIDLLNVILTKSYD